MIASISLIWDFRAAIAFKQKYFYAFRKYNAHYLF